MFTGLALSGHASAAGLTSMAGGPGQRQNSLNQRSSGPIGRLDSPHLGQPSGLSGMPGLPAAANGGAGGMGMAGACLPDV